MRLKALTELTYIERVYPAGALFDALDRDGRDMISQSLAVPFNLEDPSTRSLADILESLEPPEPPVPPVTLSPTSAAPDATASSASFTVTMTGPGISGTWTVDKDAAATWLTVDSPTTPQTADGPVNYSVTANTGAARSANIYVNGQTFTVTQAAGV